MISFSDIFENSSKILPWKKNHLARGLSYGKGFYPVKMNLIRWQGISQGIYPFKKVSHLVASGDDEEQRGWDGQDAPRRRWWGITFKIIVKSPGNHLQNHCEITGESPSKSLSREHLHKWQHKSYEQTPKQQIFPCMINCVNHVFNLLLWLVLWAFSMSLVWLQPQPSFFLSRERLPIQLHLTFPSTSLHEMWLQSSL